MTSKPVEKSWIGLFCSCLPVRDIRKRVGMRERRIVRARVEGFKMGEGEDGTDVVRAACWKLCDAKDSCGSAPLCEGWERETMTGRELGWLTRSMRALPMSLLTGTVTSGERWWLHSEQM